MCGTMQRQTDAENSFDLSDFSETDSLILKLLLFQFHFCWYQCLISHPFFFVVFWQQ